MGKKRFFSIRIKMYIFVFLATFTVVFGVSMIAYKTSAKSIDDYYKQASSNNAKNVASFVDGDDLCGLAKVEAKSKSDVDDDTDIHGITFLSDTGETNLKIDGVGNGSTKDEVISKLGQPENSTSAKGLKYTSGDYTAVFMIDDSDTVYGMGIYDKEANGDN